MYVSEMKEIYLEFENAYGRLANQLYLVLQAFKYSNDVQRARYILNVACVRFGLEPTLRRLNLGDYIISRNDIQAANRPVTVIKNTSHPQRSYHQLYNEDFTLPQIEKFIKTTILQSALFSALSEKHTVNDNDIAIHIRNTDYIGTNVDCFDRLSYIGRCMKSINRIENMNLHVFSDDQTLTRAVYSDLFSAFNSVTYVTGNSAEEDLLYMSLFRHKILLNSTYAYWAAFIGNCIYDDTYDCVYAPSVFNDRSIIGDRLNPMWNVLNV